VTSDATAAFVGRMSQTQRLGDIKPTALSRLDGWSEYFQGHYVADERD
jgi:hypothetical protein